MEDNNRPTIEITANAMSASLVLPEGFDRSTLTAALCESLLKQAEIHPAAIDADALSDAIAQAMAAEPGRFAAKIAQAKAAVHGVDARVEWNREIVKAQPSLVDEDEDEDLDEGDDDGPKHTPQQSDSSPDGEEAVCFYGRSNFTVVKTGDVLGTLKPEVPGTEGMDVHGQVIAARTAKPLELKHDESIAVDPQHRLISQIDGVLIRDRTTARVSDTLTIDENVDFSTGNIDFPGNVVVRQGVKDCFTVQARDDIEVRGLIEAANLIAGKHLRSKGGFAGREQGNAETGGDLIGKYLDGVAATVGGDLRVEREIINCNTDVLGNIDSPRGSLIGGCTHVSGKVELMDLGASAHPITELHVGSLPKLDPLIEQLAATVQQMVDQRDELLKEQEMIVANSGARIAPTHRAKLDQIQQTMGRLQLQLDRAEPALKAVNERAESIRTIDLKVNRQLHQNALIVCGAYRYRVVNDIKGPVHITANKRGQLEFQTGDSKPQLLSREAELRSAA